MADIELIQKYSDDKIGVVKNGPWLVIYNKITKREQVMGKYLFFSPDREKLIKIAKKALLEKNLSFAKIPADNYTVGTDAVLCIYDKEPNFEKEMEKYLLDLTRYKGWKSDADTRNGIYSDEFKKLISNKV